MSEHDEEAGQERSASASSPASSPSALPSSSGTSSTSTPSGSRLQRRLRRVAAWRSPPPRVRSLLLIVAGLAVAVGTVWSLSALDITLADLEPLPLLALVVAITPATIWINATELRVMTHAIVPADRRMGWATALRTVLVATAANLLPLPGGAVVRIQAMRALGATTGRATTINLVGAGAWVSAGLLVAVVAAAGAAPWAAVGTAALVGVAGLGTTTVLVLRLVHRARGRALASILAVETATAVLHGLRLLIVLLALGLEVSLQQGLALGAATPLAAAAGVFPSGVGLAEGMTALIAPLVALPAAAGFAATALGRVVGLAVTAPLALLIGARDLRQTARGEAPPAPEGDPPG